MNDFLQSLRNGQAEKPRTPKTRKNVDNSYQYTNNNRFANNSYGQGYQNPRNPNMKRQMPPGMPHQGGNHLPAEDANVTLLADILDNLSNHVESLVKNQEYMVNIQERTADMLERQAAAIERIAHHLNLSSGIEDDSQPAFENHYVSSQEPEDNLDDIPEDNIGNKWVEPVVPPVSKQMAAPVVPTTPKTQVTPEVKRPDTNEPVLRKRRKIVEKRRLAPQVEALQTPKAKARTPKAPKETKTSTPKTVSKTGAKLMPRDKVMGIIQSMREEGATFDEVAKRLVDLGQPTFSGRGEWHAQTIHRLCSKK